MLRGQSGTGKTSGAAPFRDLLGRIEAALTASHKAAEVAHRESLATWQADGSEGPKPIPPVRESFLISGTTFERLCEDMQSSPRGLFVYCEELAGF